MVQAVVSRSQRRIERKQLMLIVVLILAVSVISFSLGVIYGQRGPAGQGADVVVDSPIPAKVSQLAPPPPPQDATVTEKPERLTFYDNLPKGDQAPLGSGINLPPVLPTTTVQAKPESTVEPAEKPPAVVTGQVSAPTVAAKGSFVVQIASLRSHEDAKGLAVRLELYKLSTFIETADLGTKGVWHRVLAGPYKTRESADRAAALLKEKERLSALVRQR